MRRTTSASHESSRVTPVRDAAVRDAPPVRTDAFVARDTGVLTCADCDCGWGGFDAGSAPQCEAIGLWSCCAAVGPMAPPDLPA